MKPAQILVALSVLILPAAAFCQTQPDAPPAPPASPAPEADEPLRRAKEEFKQGLALLEQERIEEAHAAFEASFTQFPSKQNAINSALTLDRLGKGIEALDRYELVLQRFSAELSADEQDAIRKVISGLVNKVATVMLRTSGPPVDVTIDAVRVVKVDRTARVRLPPGRHELTVSIPDFVPWHQALVLPGGTEADVSISLTPIAKAVQLPAVAAPDTSPKSEVVRWPGWVGLGAGIVATGIGAYLGGRAVFDYADATNACPARVDCDPTVSAQARDARSLGWVSTGFFVGGLVSAAVGTILLVRPIRVSTVGTGMAVTWTYF